MRLNYLAGGYVAAPGSGDGIASCSAAIKGQNMFGALAILSAEVESEA